uniref:Ionotropic receptor 10 n=1 Tax=Cephus cinctus TaxID=211228 RepID=A0A1W6L1K3_CEPCN|nr:ionotropic receptor 10 [Cephus cinctus]
MTGFELMLIEICSILQNVTSNNSCLPSQVKKEIPSRYDDQVFSAVAPYLSETRNNFPTELRITTLQDPPLSGTKLVNGSLVGVGHAFYIFNLMQAKLNFTYKIILPERNILGDESSGVFGLLYTKQVDMAVAFLPVLSEAHNTVKYGTYLDEMEWTILMKRPQESATGSGLLAPFDTTVWILILISVIIVGPTIYILIYIRSKISQEKSEHYSVATCMWFVYGALLKQGSTISPVTDSARLLFATWWIFITILTSFYTANLTAFLTLSQFTLPIKSVDDLASKGQVWVAEKGLALDMIVAEGNELQPLNLSTSKGKGHFVDLRNKSYSTVIRHIDQNKMFLGEKHFVQGLIFYDYIDKSHKGIDEGKRCTYVIMPGHILLKRRAFAYPLGSLINVVMDKHILALVESGIVKYITTAYLPGTEICPLNLGSKERQLRNSDLTMTYKVVFIGFTVAAVAFLVELLYLCKCKKKKKKKKW